MNCDIYFLSETHLKQSEPINIDDFEWYGQYRKINVKKNQRRVMGGIGFLIKKHLYKDYNIQCVDSTFEGILVYSLQHKISLFYMFIIGCYLPPEYSFHGRDSGSYFNHIRTLLFQCLENSDILLLCGDLNARISQMIYMKILIRMIFLEGKRVML